MRAGHESGNVAGAQTAIDHDIARRARLERELAHALMYPFAAAAVAFAIILTAFGVFA
jgi:type II secretory pathway component PulF